MTYLVTSHVYVDCAYLSNEKQKSELVELILHELEAMGYE